MASTPTQGFPYPVPNDIPDVPSDIRALAEALDTKISDLDATISDLQSRTAALEDGTGGAGWIPIATGSDSGSTFSVDLTAGGKFPSPPLWNLVRVHMRADLDAAGEIRLQINGDGDSVYRSGAAMFDAESPANSDPSNWHRFDQPTWSIAHLSTISTGNLILTLFHTAANPGLINFQCTSARQSDDANVHRQTIASGSLTSAKTPTSLLFRTGAGATEYVDAWWWAEGLRMVPPS